MTKGVKILINDKIKLKVKEEKVYREGRKKNKRKDKHRRHHKCRGRIFGSSQCEREQPVNFSSYNSWTIISIVSKSPKVRLNVTTAASHSNWIETMRMNFFHSHCTWTAGSAPDESAAVMTAPGAITAGSSYESSSSGSGGSANDDSGRSAGATSSPTTAWNTKITLFKTRSLRHQHFF